MKLLEVIKNNARDIIIHKMHNTYQIVAKTNKVFNS